MKAQLSLSFHIGFIFKFRKFNLYFNIVVQYTACTIYISYINVSIEMFINMKNQKKKLTTRDLSANTVRQPNINVKKY